MITILAMVAIYYVGMSQGVVMSNGLIVVCTLLGLIIEAFIATMIFEKPSGVDTRNEQ